MKKVIRLFDALKYAGVDSLDKYDSQRIISSTINGLCLIIVGLNIIAGTIVFKLNGNKPILIGALVEAALSLGILGLNALKKYTLATICFYLIINVSTLYFAATLGQTAEVQVMALFILSLIFFIFSRLIIRAVCVAITLLLLILLELNFHYHIIQPQGESPSMNNLIRWISYAAVISLVIRINFIYARNKGLLVEQVSFSKMRSSLSAEEKQNKVKTLAFQHYTHDIRGAYFGVSSVCAVLHLSRNEKPELIQSLIDSLMNASENYKYILDHFLEYSRVQVESLDTLYPEELNVKEEFERIINLNTYLALENDIKIDFYIEPDFPESLFLDKLKVTRIFMNLLNNAIKFTRQGSTVSIRVQKENSSWKLIVSDQGEGIPEEKREKIFEPFVTELTPKNPDGTGLGLYITKYLVDLLKGNIVTKSTIGVGSSFEVSLPLESE